MDSLITAAPAVPAVDLQLPASGRTQVAVTDLVTGALTWIVLSSFREAALPKVLQNLGSFRRCCLEGAFGVAGYAVVQEPGRRIVKEELEGNGSALPWVDQQPSRVEPL